MPGAEAPAGPGNRQVVLEAMPLVAAVFVFGISFGVLAAAARTPAWLAVLMSTTVFAGSAQFATLSIAASGGGLLAALGAGLLLNLRYAAVAAHAGPALPRGRLRRLLLSQLVIDESYVLGLRHAARGLPDGRTMVLSGFLLWAAWVSGTAIGSVAGPFLGDPRRLGLDAAFPAAFVALLLPLLRTKRARLAAALGGAAALVVAPFTPPGVALAVAAVAGLVVGRGEEAEAPA